MAEIAVVAAVVGVVGGLAAMGVSAAAERSKRGTKLKAIYAQLEQIRARHLSASASSASCLRMTKTGPSTFEIEEREDCTQPGSTQTIDFKALNIATGASQCVDNLARPVSCTDLEQQTQLVFDIEIDGRPGCDGIVVWRSNGRLTANFFVNEDPSADVQPHLSDASSHLTPEPTATGQFAGSTTNPRGLLE